ncbi:hypothetical protein HFO56_03375 [Rhizobium laguerreae]|uniref:hypothetical protein n=1 Tax=Rhizobium laguerreae TaxID=1076926 RepID=UPI001C910DF5|nr:hypothetical protein [Rhizobium laguerreae]MBY3151429.1 hypothetical protein [Rhizobium laguerreae]
MVPGDPFSYGRPAKPESGLMLFSVPVFFNLTATRIGGERRQSTQAWNVVDFEMTDMASDDVPVVLRWRQDFDGIAFTRSAVVNGIGAAPSDEPMHIRKFGEAFLKPVVLVKGINSITQTSHGQDACFLTGEAAAGMLASYQDTSIFGTTLPGETHQRRLRNNGGNGLADFESVDRLDLDRKVGMIRERLAKYMLVDGVLYERCPEPKVVVFSTEVEFEGGARQMGTFALIATNQHLLTAFDKNAEVFELEDYGSAIAKTRRANASRARKDLLALANDRMAPEIDQMESIYAGDVAWMRQATRIALEMAGWIGSQRLGEVSEEPYSAYQKLHKSLHMFDSEERFALMSEGMAGIAAECRSTERQHVETAAIAGLEILDNRPVAVVVTKERTPTMG